MGNCGLAPTLKDRVKRFAHPILKSGYCLRPPFNMAKTSSQCVKTTLKVFVTPFGMAKTFFRPSSFS